MAGQISLPYWPTTPNCVQWSGDNQIAVACGETVAVISPKIRGFEAGQLQWNTAYIAVTGFTADEVPRNQPSSSSGLSVSEELSVWQIEELAWSAPGLSHHGRSALAVLTSNHILSIWTTDGDPSLKETWRRRVIVNDVVRSYYVDIDPSSRPQIFASATKKEFVRAAQRIRNCIWIPPVADLQQNDIAAQSAHSQTLVVSTNAGDIFCLAIERRYKVEASVEQDWRAVIRAVYRINTDPREAVITPMSDVERTSPNMSLAVASNLACGSWSSLSGDEMTIPLAYTCQGRLFVVALCAMRADLRSEINFRDRNDYSWIRLDRKDISGPLRFIGSASDPSLLAISTGMIHLITPRDHLSSPLDDRWDDITGIAVSRLVTDHAAVNMVSQLSTVKLPALSFALPLLSTRDMNSTPRWWSAIDVVRRSFSQQYNLHNKTVERVWGMASSPFGDYLATCVSIHLGNFPAYVIPSDKTSVLNITREELEGTPIDLLQHARGRLVSSSAIFFVLQQSLKPPDEIGTKQAVDVEDLTQRATALLRALNHDMVMKDASREIDSTETPLYVLQRRIYLDSDTQEWRARRLAECIAQGDGKRVPISQNMVEQLAKQVIDMIGTVPEIYNIDSRIRQVFQTLSSKLNNVDVDLTMNDDSAARETCIACEEAIRFDSIRWAKCSNAHLYTRCATSFLAIQSASYVKSCAICGLQSIDATLHPELQPLFHSSLQDLTQQPSISPEFGIAQTLFTALHLCVYCGGDFIT